MVLCFFVIGVFCDLTEYQAAILHLKREHKEEIENLQVCLWFYWTTYLRLILSFLCAEVNISLSKAYLPKQHRLRLPVGTESIPGMKALDSVINIIQFL